MSRHLVLSRRALLRGMLGGAGVAVGLPVLEAMLDRTGTALAGGVALPRRFGLWFWGNGSDPDRWAPATEGPGWEPSPMLEPLADVKDYVNVVSGTTLRVRGQNNPHVEGAIAILSGGNPLIHETYAGESNDWDYMTVPAPSVDQLAADHLGGDTPFRSLVLAVTTVHTVDAGSSNAPGTAVSYVSHSAPYLFNPPHMDPVEVFDYLFGGGLVRDPDDDTAPDRALLARASILDAVLGDAAGLRRRLGRTDRLRLDEHMDGVRALEQRLRALPPPAPSNACGVPAMPVASASYRERARAMADLVAMAFACDLTRAVSLQFTSPASHVDYPDVFPNGITFNGAPTSFHEYAHNAGIDDTVRTGVSYFVELYGAFLSALRAMPEGDGNVLDNSCILGTTDVAYGPNHGFTNYPLLVGGSAGGALQYPGVHVVATDDAATKVPLTCLRAVGVPIETWGEEQLEADATIGAIETGA